MVKCKHCGFAHDDAFTAAKCDNARSLGLKLKTALTLHVVEDAGDGMEKVLQEACERRSE